MSGQRGRRLPLRTASAVALLIALAVTALATWGVTRAVHDQERRLLKERTTEVGLLLTQAIDAIPTELAQQGAILQATGGSTTAYEQAVAKSVAAAPGPNKPTYAWLQQVRPGAFTVKASAGTTLHPGELIIDARVTALAAALHSPKVVPTPLIGPQRILGLALGPPSAPAGTVLYRETPLGPTVSPPRTASTDPYAELAVTLYSTRTPQPSTILVSTTRAIPLRGQVRNQLLAVGDTRWLLAVKARSPLVGGLTAYAPWITLGAGILASLLIALVVESAARRRDTALTLYESEHHLAETLQRSLLPQLPELPHLTLAARYLASGTGQQVGGDWFDVFPVAGDRVGLVVGDVIGHNLAAASAMAQIRSLVRGYAIDGDSPANVITRLDHIVDALQLTQFVTVFYGLLEPPAADGSRVLTYTNAGHVPPMVRHGDGTVESLTGGDSIVIGAPIDSAHNQGEQRLDPESTLVLYTDGLVEVPGASLTDGLHDLAASVAAQAGSSPEELCDHLLTGVSVRSRRDDVALLVVRLGTPATRTAAPRATVPSTATT